MLDVIFANDRKVAENWKKEAATRRRLSQVDPVADTLDYCASELLEQVRTYEQTSHWLTVAQYAQLKLVTPQTVRNWIRRGELRAEDDGKGGWLIPRGAERTKRRRGRAGADRSAA